MSLSQVLTFEPGSNRVCTEITIFDDSVFEPTECFLVSATFQQDDRNIRVDSNNATVCIVDEGMILSVCSTVCCSSYMESLVLCNDQGLRPRKVK